jgi:tRNA(Ile)-lysidine synthase
VPTADVVRWCREEGLLQPGDRVLVGVSAGADSTALASVLVEAREHGLPLHVVLAHVDHGWRGPEEARADRASVEALGRRLGVPVDVSPPPPPGPRTEDAARRWRYSSLAAAAHRHGCRKVATGHHLRDQAETFLLRLLRGSGPVGLGGIPSRRALDGGRLEVVRPLLRVEPERLRAHLEARGIPWREDSTNADRSRDRNAVRERLRALEARGAAATRRLADLADRLRRRVAARAEDVGRRLAGDVRVHALEGAVEVPRASLVSLAPAELELALRALGAPLRADRDGPWFTRRHVRIAARLLEDEGTLELPRGLVLRVGPRTVLLARRHPRREQAPAPTLVREDVPACRFDLAAFARERPPGTAALDAERLGPRAVLRPLAKDDRFAPLGAAPVGEATVAGWLARRGVPAILRRATWVVEGASGVAWVVGHRIDARHAVTPATRVVARLRVVPPPG